MAADHATASKALLPMGIPVSSPRRVWMIGVKGWLRANQATPAGMLAVGTKALDMNGATTMSSERLFAPAGVLASRPKETVSQLTATASRAKMTVASTHSIAVAVGLNPRATATGTTRTALIMARMS